MIYRFDRHDRQFTAIDNRTLRDGSLSFRARGLLAYILSLPPDAPVTLDALIDRASEGRDAIRSAYRELVECRYVLRRREPLGRGRFRTVTDVFEHPTLAASAVLSAFGLTGVGEPVSGATSTNAPLPPESGSPKSANQRGKPVPQRPKTSMKKQPSSTDEPRPRQLPWVHEVLERVERGA